MTLATDLLDKTEKTNLSGSTLAELNGTCETGTVKHLRFKYQSWTHSSTSRVYDTIRFTEETDKMEPLIAKFKVYSKRKKNLTVSRYLFNTRAQKSMESFMDYLTVIKTLLKHCEFQALENDLLTDKIVCGIRDDNVRERLLRNDKLTLYQAIDTCKLAEVQANQIKSLSASHESEVHAVGKQCQSVRSKSTTNAECWYDCPNCAYAHEPGQCPALINKCSKSSQRDHSSARCKKTSGNENRPKKGMKPQQKFHGNHDNRCCSGRERQRTQCTVKAKKADNRDSEDLIQFMIDSSENVMTIMMEEVHDERQKDCVETVDIVRKAVTGTFKLDSGSQLDMDQVIEGVYVGGRPDLSDDGKALVDLGITHVLTVNAEPVECDSEELKFKFIPALDLPGADLLSYFQESFNFIDEARQAGAVLIHCMAGMSRSATIAAAYLMRLRKTGVEETLAAMRKQRSCIRPNIGFMEQLELFEAMGCEIAENSDVYRKYRLNMLADRIQSANAKDGMTFHAGELLANPLAGQNKGGYFKCAKCRQALFRSDGVLSHSVGVGEAAFDWRSKVPSNKFSQMSISESDLPCNKSLFIEPVQWMAPSISELEGKLNCPKCRSKLGSFVWYGERCPCGAWVAPAFHVQKTKVDECKPAPSLPSPTRPDTGDPGPQPLPDRDIVVNALPENT